MWPVSARFLAALRGPHQIVVRAQILVGGEVVQDWLPVEGGQVVMDRTNTHQRTASVTLAAPTLLPITSASQLAPFGAELRIWRGIRWTDDDMELVPLFTGPIQDSDADIGTLVTSISAEDRSRRVSDARFETTYQIAAGSDPAAAWQALILSRVTVPVSTVSTGGFVTPLLTYPAQDDPWEACGSIAASVGCVGEFDGLGVATLRSITPPSPAAPVWTVDDGDQGVMIGGTVTMSRRDSANRIIGTGGNSSAGAVWTSIATDDDPASPSYYYGGFGPKPDFVEFPAAGSQVATDAATAGELNRRRGVARTMTVRSIVNPALVPDDTLAIRRTAVGIDEVAAIDRITIGLDHAGVQQIEMRTVQAL